MNKRYFSTEDGNIVTLEYLKECFDEFYRDDYEPDEFPLFVTHCTTGNGTLKPIDDRYTDDVLYYDVKTGRICDREKMLDCMFWYGYVNPTDDEIGEYFWQIGD